MGNVECRTNILGAVVYEPTPGTKNHSILTYESIASQLHLNKPPYTTNICTLEAIG